MFKIGNMSRDIVVVTSARHIDDIRKATDGQLSSGLGLAEVSCSQLSFPHTTEVLFPIVRLCKQDTRSEELFNAAFTTFRLFAQRVRLASFITMLESSGNLSDP